MQDNIKEIKDRLDIVEVISEFVKLKKAGANFQASCPFHRETRASFIVSPTKQIWHCFGSCDEGGDIFKFIMKIEGLEFPEALRLLADKAGVRLKKIDPKVQTEKNRLLDFNERSASYFVNCLKAKPEAQKYLKERGLRSSTIKEWRIGYCPKNSKTLRMFRERIIFPINDQSGRVIGFVGRILKDAPTAKYINSPESLLYNKSRTLFGFDRAKEAIRKKNSCFLVEGNLDVILSHQDEIKNVVASSGSALSEEQLQLIGRLSKNLILAFDADEAGEKTTKRALELALAKDFNVKILALSRKDPAELVQLGAWKKEIKKAKPILEYFFDLVFKKYNADLIADKKKIAQELLPWIARFVNQIQQAYWLQKLAEKLDLPEEALREGLPRLSQELEQQEAKRKSFASLEERLAALCFKLKKSNKITKKYKNKKDQLILRIEQENIKDYKKEFSQVKQRLQDLQVRFKLKELAKQIKQAEINQDDKTLKNLITQFNNVLKLQAKK